MPIIIVKPIGYNYLPEECITLGSKEVVTKIRNGTERNGTVLPTKIRVNARNRTVTEQLGLVVWLHGLLPVNNERIFRFANGWDVLSLCVRKLAFMDQQHCRDDTH